MPFTVTLRDRTAADQLAVRDYIAATHRDVLIHREVVRAVHGLVVYLQTERKRMPNEVLLEAQRWNVCSFSVTTRTSKETSPHSLIDATS